MKETMIPLPSDLVMTHECPNVPASGTNATLLDWAMTCAANTRKLNDQIERLRTLETQ